MEVWLEEMTKEEISFLTAQHDKEVMKLFSIFKKLISILLIIFVVVYGIMLTAYYTMPEEDKVLDINGVEEFNPQELTIIMLIAFVSLTVFIGMAFVISYFKQFYSMKKDIDHGLKIIEITTILEKKFIPQNNSCFFVVESQFKRIHEVDTHIYNFFQEGDEVNIELTQHSRIDLGIF